jgi:hypothetical protein
VKKEKSPLKLAGSFVVYGEKKALSGLGTNQMGGGVHTSKAVHHLIENLHEFAGLERGCAGAGFAAEHGGKPPAAVLDTMRAVQTGGRADDGGDQRLDSVARTAAQDQIEGMLAEQAGAVMIGMRHAAFTAALFQALGEVGKAHGAFSNKENSDRFGIAGGHSGMLPDSAEFLAAAGLS